MSLVTFCTRFLTARTFYDGSGSHLPSCLSSFASSLPIQSYKDDQDQCLGDPQHAWIGKENQGAILVFFNFWCRLFFLITSTEVYGDPEVHPQSEEYWGHVNPVRAVWRVKNLNSDRLDRVHAMTKENALLKHSRILMLNKTRLKSESHASLTRLVQEWTSMMGASSAILLFRHSKEKISPFTETDLKLDLSNTYMISLMGLFNSWNQITLSLSILEIHVNSPSKTLQSWFVIK